MTIIAPIIATALLISGVATASVLTKDEALAPQPKIVETAVDQVPQDVAVTEQTTEEPAKHSAPVVTAPEPSPIATCPDAVSAELADLSPKKAAHDQWVSESRQAAITGLEARGEPITEERLQKLIWARTPAKYDMWQAITNRVNTLLSTNPSC